MSNIYSEYKLKVGLEIHLQLNTRRKLFCNCPVDMNKEIYGMEFIRRLRPTQSELGQVDPAAYFEFEKGLEIKYYSPDNLTCLVEIDEEPPHTPDTESIETALGIAKFFNMYIVDEIHFMRKVVIDGSNTTGFQRTAVIGLDGYFILDGKRYGIQSLCLEEEAARLIERRGNQVIYYLDRMGIPLIELSTAPDINDPEEAVRVAEYIGRVVQASGKRRRGLGTIRQDINISILNGPVVEIKGVQRLHLLKDVIKYELNRQLNLLRLKDEIKKRNIKKEDIINEEYIDLTEVYKNTESKILRRVISKGGKIFGMRVPGFKGLLGYKIAKDKTFGKEIVERIRFWTGIKGLFHSDELPSYGISLDEVNNTKEKLSVKDEDAFIIIGLEPDIVDLTFSKIKERIIEALDGVPPETRGAKDDGSTYYMRPRPGMARMYPETDIPPICVSKDLLKRVMDNMIIDPENIINNLSDEYGLTREKAEQIFDLGFSDYFIKLYNLYHDKLSSGFIASVIIDYPKALEREGYDVSALKPEIFEDILDMVSKKIFEKELVYDLLKIMLSENLSLKEAVSKLKISRVDLNDVKTFLKKLLKDRSDILKLPINIRRKRLIGIVMSQYRGRINPKDAINIVEEVLKNV